jgi:ribosomal protein S18 acetylase RimI-like enzyme
MMIKLRRATEADVDFIVKAIIGAEKSGTDKLPYATVFGISEPQVEEILKNAVLEDIPGNELCISGFMIACIDEVPSGAVCSWIEGADDMPSAILKANILYHFLGSDLLERASQNSKLIDQLYIPRETGTLQIESVFVSNKFRGLGISNKLILEQIKETLLNEPDLTKVQIQLAATNESALHSYLKLGFKSAVTKKCEDAKILELLPSDTKIMMELSVEELIKKGLINLS